MRKEYQQIHQIEAIAIDNKLKFFLRKLQFIIYIVGAYQIMHDDLLEWIN